jgi:UDP-2,3-diacylglucosamine pyrophosphatase LpxH
MVEKVTKVMINKKNRYRSIFISDVHLGTRRVLTSELYSLISRAEYEYLYLLGDIVDTWRSHDRFYWSAEQRRLLMAFVEKSTDGVEVRYTPGNHDDAIGDVIDPALDYLPSRNEYIHQTANGRSLLVTHGDQFDKVVKHSPMSAAFGSLWWTGIDNAEKAVNGYRRLRRLPRFGLSLGVRKLISDIIGYESNFIECALKAVRERDCDGVVCGHTHQPALREYENGIYANCGDWVACGSAIIERYDGGIELIYSNGRLGNFDERRRERAGA